MDTDGNYDKPYDLAERIYAFALESRLFLKDQRWDSVSWSDLSQVLRTTGSIAANYGEALEAISPDDYLYLLRLCKKEARESRQWLRLISDCNSIDEGIHGDLNVLIKETTELVRIFAAIIRKKSAQPPLP